MRLQKFMSAAGCASRRRAEELIRAGRVSVNGKTAAIGENIEPETDRICLDGRELRLPAAHTYIMLHKPRGVVTTLRDEKGRKTVASLVKDAGVRLYPVGRLDMDSEGLLLLTDDGSVANRLAHPSHGIKKTYHAWVAGPDIEEGVKMLRMPLTDGTEHYRPAEARILSGPRDGRAVLSVTIGEGKNRQVRKMCAIAGMDVKRLVRVSQGEMRLGDLPTGHWRYLTEAETQFLRDLL